MTDFAAMMHFGSIPGNEESESGFVGGYGWVLARSRDWDSFRSEVSSHFAGLGYDVIDFEGQLEIKNAEDLNPGEQQELFERLGQFPVQYETLHLYRSDDA